MGNFNNELKEYQNIPRSLIFDKTISDRARFVFCYMAAKPDGWDFYLEPMAKEIGYSTDTLRKYINELVSNGWLTKGIQSRTEKNTFGAVEYTLHAKKRSLQKSDTENFRYGKNNAQNNIDNKRKDIYKDKRENEDIELFGTSPEVPTKTDRVPYKEIVEKYNVKFAGILPKVTAITDKRKKAMNTCVKQFGIESIEKVFDNVLSSNFLTGNNDRGWKCDFDFIFTASKYVRILEGNYRNTNGNTNGGAQSDESVMYRNFISWVNENAPRVLKMKAKLDEQGYRSIKKECGYNEMKRKLIEMNNYENLLTEYADPVMTCINWR